MVHVADTFFFPQMHQEEKAPKGKDRIPREGVTEDTTEAERKSLKRRARGTAEKDTETGRKREENIQVMTAIDGSVENYLLFH